MADENNLENKSVEQNQSTTKKVIKRKKVASGYGYGGGYGGGYGSYGG